MIKDQQKKIHVTQFIKKLKQATVMSNPVEHELI